jgi:hypothetical protein
VQKFSKYIFNLYIQGSYQRYNRNLEVELINFYASLAQVDPGGGWASIPAAIYQKASHDDDRMEAAEDKMSFAYLVSKFTRHPSHLVREAAIQKIREIFDLMEVK